MAGGDAPCHGVEGADAQARGVGDVAVEQANEKVPVRLGREGPAVGRAAQRRQGGVSGEAEALGREELANLVGPRSRPRGERTDAAHLEAVRAGALDPGHGAREVAGAALRVGDRLGPVEARAEGDVGLGEELAEPVVQEPEVALDGKAHAAWSEPLAQQRQRRAIPGRAGKERLAAVEGDIELSVACPGAADRLAAIAWATVDGFFGGASPLPLHHRGERLAAHHAAALVGAEAVGAARRAGERRQQHQVSAHGPTSSSSASRAARALASQPRPALSMRR